MKTIYKYPIPVIDGWQEFDLPECADLVHFATDPIGALCMWAEIDTLAPTEVRRFCIVGTGHPIPDGAKHMGAAIQGPFVWHLYESVL